MNRALAAAAALLLAGAPALADRIEAEAECQPTDRELEYRCTYTVAAGGEPLGGARFTVKPEMPSMPMAHNVPAVEAASLDEKGHYEAVFSLDMHGRWSMRLEFSQPRRDVVVLHRDFEPDDGEGHAREHGHGDHHDGKGH